MEYNVIPKIWHLLNASMKLLEGVRVTEYNTS